MGNSQRPKHSSEGIMYTLAQSETDNILHHPQKPNLIVSGRGTDVSDRTAIEGKAKRKLITQKLMLAMIDVLKEKGETERSQDYWNAYHCQSKVIYSNGRTYGEYCKTRYCLVCCAIRKATIVNKYLPIISQWEAPHFVTLTEVAVPKEKLRLWFRAVKVAFNRIKNKYRKRHSRGNSPKFMGIKSLECNFNPIKKTYNPHLHLIVPNEEIANILVKEWRTIWNKKEFLASRKAQKIIRITNNEKILIEILKYSSKIFTDPEMKKKKQRTIPPIIYAAAMDNIFCALKPHRIFDRFGFNLPKTKNTYKGIKQNLVEFDELTYNPNAFDWLNFETGELLTGYIPTPQLSFLLKNNIDKDST